MLESCMIYMMSVHMLSIHDGTNVVYKINNTKLTSRNNKSNIIILKKDAPEQSRVSCECRLHTIFHIISFSNYIPAFYKVFDHSL